MSIRMQMNDFGPLALLPDGRVEVLKFEAVPLIESINRGEKEFVSAEFDDLIANDLDVDLEGWHLAAPAIAFLEVTNLCNLTCKHCYAHSSPRAKRPHELSLQEIYALLDEWDRTGVLQVFLSGGELFAHPNAVEIIQYARQKSFLTQIFSNGLLIREEHLRAIPEGTAFFISFDSASPTQTIRGKMNYEKLAWLFDCMDKYGHVFRTAMNVHAQNIDEAERVFKWYREKGYPRPQWIETLPVGRALKYPEMFITPADTDRAFAAFEASMRTFVRGGGSGAGANVRAVDTIKFCQRLERALGCDKAGRMIVYVNSVGEVFPSSNFASHDRESAGNLRDASFADLWRDGFATARATWFDDFKGCAKCPVAQAGVWCQFRCRSLSQNLTGDPLVCGATPHLKDFMLKTYQLSLDMKREGTRLELV